VNDRVLIIELDDRAVTEGRVLNAVAGVPSLHRGGWYHAANAFAPARDVDPRRPTKWPIPSARFHSQADAARHFGVSEAAIHQRMKRLAHDDFAGCRPGTRRRRGDEKLTAAARLERVQQVIDEELGWAVTQARQPGADRGALADVIKCSGTVVPLTNERLSRLALTSWIGAAFPLLSRAIHAKHKTAALTMAKHQIGGT